MDDLLSIDGVEELSYRCKVCKQLFSTSAKVMTHAIKDHPAYSDDVDHIFRRLQKGEKLVTYCIDPSTGAYPMTMYLEDGVKLTGATTLAASSLVITAIILSI